MLLASAALLIKDHEMKGDFAGRMTVNVSDIIGVFRLLLGGILPIESRRWTRSCTGVGHDGKMAGVGCVKFRRGRSMPTERLVR